MKKKMLRRQEKFLGGPRNLFPQPENTGLTKEPPELSEKKPVQEEAVNCLSRSRRFCPFLPEKLKGIYGSRSSREWPVGGGGVALAPQPS